MSFIIGADISSLEAMEDYGAKYYDLNGEEGDVIKILASHGVNCIRLRLFNKPTESFDKGDYCDLKHTLRMAKRIKKYGLGFMLDFHYSDFWADWKQQKIPNDWENLEAFEIEKMVYEYTKYVINCFIEQETVDIYNNEVECKLKGRHDPCVAVRGSVVAESMMALVLADMALLNMSSKMENVKKVYS